MKKIIIVLIIISNFFVQATSKQASDDHRDFSSSASESTSAASVKEDVKGFFIPRPHSTNLLYQDAISYYYLHHERGHTLCYNGTFFSEKSRYPENIARLLLQGFAKPSLLIAQDPTFNPDINSVWLNLTANAPGFNATISLHPERVIKGLYNQFFIDLQPLGISAWADIVFAYVQAHHTLHFNEQVTVSGTGAFANAQQALNNPAWQYGKFCTDTLKKSYCDDIQLRLGYTGMGEDASVWNVYAIATIPASKDQSVATCLFEPTTGSPFYSLGMGINGDSVVWENKKTGATVVWMVDGNYRYVFAHEVVRSFDLMANGPLSRYMLVAQQTDSTQSLPAINALTQRCIAHPKNTLQLWTGVRYAIATLALEGGYNVWWRQREVITDIDPAFDPAVGVYNINGTGTSASRALISQGVGQIPVDAQFVPITAADFDVESGAAPRALTHQFYAALSWQSPTTFAFSLALGGGAEIRGNNSDAALENWLMFAKLTLGF